MRFVLATFLLSGPLFAQICDFTVTPTSFSVPAGASTGTIDVRTSVGDCRWNAASNVSWLKITSGSAYNGSANLTYSVDANVTPFDRTGTLTVAAKTVTIQQTAANCSFAVTPKSATIPVGGGTGSFSVTTNCTWQATSNNGNFITVPNDTRGTGNGTVSYSVTPNSCVAGRSGSITVNTGLSSPPVFAIAQDGSQANLSLSLTSATAGGEASDGRILVTTGTGCGWSALSDATWLQITSGAGGAGNGAIAYHLLANSTAPRTGSIHVGSATFTVTQSASGPPAPVISSIDSAANYRTDAVSPGEIIAVFGANMGPGTLAPLQVNNGAITNSLSGTQVLFDGAAAPLIYAWTSQVSAVVPYGVAGKSSTQVQVVYNGAVSNVMTMPVQAAHPAIFTKDASGLGPGAILNQDTSINSGPNAAARGSVVAIYATGGGTTNPALADGAVTGSTLPYLTQNVVVTIGGIEARVPYAGGVPGAVAGLTQINAEVPAGVTPGPSVPVVVRVGDFTSTPGVTMSVK
jgi:trimeric autotransporter adhesin